MDFLFALLMNVFFHFLLIGDLQDEDNLIRSPSVKSASTNLYLYQDDISERPHVASAISSMANYSATIQQGPADPDAKPVVKANLGTLMGVYLPCIQNIFGVILFIRMTWIVGTAGAIEAFFVVGLGCSVVRKSKKGFLIAQRPNHCLLSSIEDYAHCHINGGHRDERCGARRGLLLYDQSRFGPRIRRRRRNSLLSGHYGSRSDVHYRRRRNYDGECTH